MGSFGGPEMLVVLVLILLLFGAKRLPELARGLGKGIREFKDATQGIKDEIDKEVHKIEAPLREPEVKPTPRGSEN